MVIVHGMEESAEYICRLTGFGNRQRLVYAFSTTTTSTVTGTGLMVDHYSTSIMNIASTDSAR